MSLGSRTTLRSCCPCLDWVARAERSPRVSLQSPLGLRCPAGIPKFPLFSISLRLFSTISSIHQSRSTIFHYSRVAKMRSAAARKGLPRKVWKWWAAHCDQPEMPRPFENYTKWVNGTFEPWLTSSPIVNQFKHLTPAPCCHSLLPVNSCNVTVARVCHSSDGLIKDVW